MWRETDGLDSWTWTGRYQVTHSPGEIARKMEGGAVAVDVRPEAEYAKGHIRGALSFPLARIEADPDAFREAVRASRDGAKAALLYGAGGLTAGIHRVAALLEGHGKLAIYVYPGGLEEWRDAGRPVEASAE